MRTLYSSSDNKYNEFYMISVETRNFTELTRPMVDGIVSRLRFKPGEDVEERWRAWYDGRERSFICGGTYEGQAAVIKIISDPREIDSAAAQQQFLSIPDTGSVRTPHILHSEKCSPQQTVIIMEQLPEDAVQLQSPLSDNERESFLAGPFADVIRLKKQFGYREPIETEQLTVPDFCMQRFTAWEQAAKKRIDEEGITTTLLDDMSQKQASVVDALHTTYGDTALEWAYGLPKPDKFHRLITAAGAAHYYLTDFKLVAKRPPAYELAVAIWADAIMSSLAEAQTKQMSTEEIVALISERVQHWINDWKIVAERQNLPNENQYLKAALAERVIGSIYADSIAQTALAWPEVERRVAILKQYLTTLL